MEQCKCGATVHSALGGGRGRLIEEPRLMILYAELLVDSGNDALYLSQSEHSSEEGVSGIVSLALIAEHCHTVIHTHRQQCCFCIALGRQACLLFLLEYLSQLNDVCSSSQVACLGEVAVREDVA